MWHFTILVFWQFSPTIVFWQFSLHFRFWQFYSDYSFGNLSNLPIPPISPQYSSFNLSRPYMGIKWGFICQIFFNNFLYGQIFYNFHKSRWPPSSIMMLHQPPASTSCIKHLPSIINNLPRDGDVRGGFWAICLVMAMSVEVSGLF